MDEQQKTDAAVYKYFGCVMSNTLSSDLADVLDFTKGSEGYFALEHCEIKRSALGGLGVFAKHDIGHDTLLLKLPKTSIFSASNSTIANLLVEEEIDGVLATIIAFIYETTVFREGSHWYQYLKSIKTYDSNGRLILPPNHWDSVERNLLKGSTLDTLHGGLVPEDEVREGFEIATSIARKWEEGFGLEAPLNFFGESSKDMDLQYLRFVAVAYAVSSRIFEIDAFHGSALVPVADLFNHHVLQPHVHFNSLYDVCELCGEPGMCSHMLAETMTKAAQDEGPGDLGGSKIDFRDNYEHHSVSDEDRSGSDDDSRVSGEERSVSGEDSSVSGEDRSGSDEDADDANNPSDDLSVDMVLVNDIKAGEEIFNSYGELSNPLLLARYGFCIPSNQLDIVHLGKEVSSFAKNNPKFKERLKWWSRTGHALYEDWLDMMEDPGSDGESEQGNDQAGAKPWLSEMYIDFDGHLSPILKALINLLSLNHKDWKKLRDTIELDISGNLKSFSILDRKANQDHRRIFLQLLSSKKLSQPSEATANDAHIRNQDRFACIKILLENERNIIERARKLASNN